MLHAKVARVLDACVLAPYNLFDLLTRLAEEPCLYVPKWSNKILNEVWGIHVHKFKYREALANSWQTKIRRGFPEALIGGYEKYLPICKNHEKDRHVLACAIEANAAEIITFNLKDFKEEHLQPFGIRAVHPEEFLINMHDVEPALVTTRIEHIATSLRCSPEMVLHGVAKIVPEFSSHMLRQGDGWSAAIGNGADQR